MGYLHWDYLIGVAFDSLGDIFIIFCGITMRKNDQRGEFEISLMRNFLHG